MLLCAAEAISLARSEEDMDRLLRAVEACRAREEAEAGYIRRYREGETPLTVSGITAVLQEKGLTTDVEELG